MTYISIQRLMGVCALALASLLSACGGTSSTVNPLHPTRIIAFGDAFSDVGNSASNGGLRFTIRGTTTANTLTTPTTMAETLANIYGLWGAMTAMPIGQSGPFPAAGLVSYAQGNSMVSPRPSTLSPNPTLDGMGGTDVTLTQQVDDFLTRVNHKVGEDDLILITAGTRDLFGIAYRYFGNVGVSLASGGALTIDATRVNNLGGSLTYPGVFTELDRTASTLVTVVDTLIQAGAKHILLVEPMNLARTPWGLSLDTTGINFLRSLSYDTDQSCVESNTYNSLHCKVTIALNKKYPPTVAGQKVLAVDLAQFFNLISGSTATGNANTYASYFSQPPATPACSVLTFGTTPTFDTGYSATDLSKTNGCNADPSIWSDTSYTRFLFADNLNLTPQGNALLASAIYNSNMYRAAWR